MDNIEIVVGSRIEFLEIAGVNCIVVEGVDGNRYASRLHFEPLQNIKDNPNDPSISLSQLCSALVNAGNKVGENYYAEHALFVLREELIRQCV